MCPDRVGKPSGQSDPHKPVNSEDDAYDRKADGGVKPRVCAMPLVQLPAAGHDPVNLLGNEALEIM
jgi:hypothetical protein